MAELDLDLILAFFLTFLMSAILVLFTIQTIKRGRKARFLTVGIGMGIIAAAFLLLEQLDPSLLTWMIVFPNATLYYHVLMVELVLYSVLFFSLYLFFEQC